MIKKNDEKKRVKPSIYTKLRSRVSEKFKVLKNDSKLRSRTAAAAAV